MTDTEFYQTLVTKTGKVSALKVKDESLASLCYSLMMAQVTLNALDALAFSEHKGEFDEVFHHYVPRSIVGQGQYLAQLNHVLDHFKPQNPSPYKTLTKAVFAAAKYLSPYASYADYKAKVLEKCTDEKTTLSFLENFRLQASLPKMYFWKTCAFFYNQGILEVPSLTSASKDTLIEAFSLPDENVALYQKVIALSKANNVSVTEINQRLAKISAHA